MSSQEGWIGVDLDKTIAYYTHWEGADKVGAPLPEMVKRVHDWLNSGVKVRIFTARVFAPVHNAKRQREAAVSMIAIQDWCQKHLGVVLPVTCVKDQDMIEIWDDRAKQVIPNTGLPVKE